MRPETSKCHQHRGYIWTLANLNNELIASGGRDKTIKIWTSDLKPVRTFKAHDKSVLKILDCGNNEMLSCSRDRTIKKWGYDGQLVKTVALNEVPLSMTKSNDCVAIGTAAGRVIFLDSNLNICSSVQVSNGWIWEVKFIGNLLLCVSDQRELIKVDLQGHHECVYQHGNGLFSIEHVEGTTILCGTLNGEILRINLANGCANSYPIHADIVRSIRVIRNGVYSASEDGFVKCTQLDHGSSKPIERAENFMQDVCLLQDVLYSAGFDGQIRPTKLEPVSTKHLQKV